MTTYGYRVGLFQITQKSKKDPLAMSEKIGGQTIAEWIVSELEKMKGVGVPNEKRSTYFSLDEIKTAGWLVRMTGSSGSFGTPAKVVDIKTGQTNHSKAIGEEEAVLKDARILAVIPPSMNVFVAAFEVQGHGSLMTHFAQALDKALVEAGYKLRGEHEMADRIAWSKYLKRPDVGIQGVNLVQRGDHIDGAIEDSDGVRKLQLTLQVDRGGAKANILMQMLQRFRGSRHERLNVGAIFGLEAEFDDQKIVTIQDGRQRSIDVSAGWPRFVYNIDERVRPSGEEFELACQEVLEEILEVEGVTRDAGWWAVGPWS